MPSTWWEQWPLLVRNGTSPPSVDSSVCFNSTSTVLKGNKFGGVPIVLLLDFIVFLVCFCHPLCHKYWKSCDLKVLCFCLYCPMWPRPLCFFSHVCHCNNCTRMFSWHATLSNTLTHKLNLSLFFPPYCCFVHAIADWSYLPCHLQVLLLLFAIIRRKFWDYGRLALVADKDGSVHKLTHFRVYC